MSEEFKNQQEYEYSEKARQLLDELPKFCMDFYTGRSLRLTGKTQYDYASKMKIFLSFLHNECETYSSRPIREYTYHDLETVTVDDARRFVSFLKNKKARNNSLAKNKKTTIENYVACISAYYTYFIRNHLIACDNPFRVIEHERKKRKDIVYLNNNDTWKLKNEVETGAHLIGKSKAHHDRTFLRELCIIQLLLDTGIRVSELVGLDLNDICFDECMLSVQRKGDKPDRVYFSDETADLLKEYIQCRGDYFPTDDEQALFLSSTGQYKGQRLSVRSVERIVKKYAQASRVTNAEKITPHKLRSTFAMAMLEANGGQLALVSEELGHSSIATTQIYARVTDEHKKANRNLLQK